jgi:hypothetical protein
MRSDISIYLILQAPTNNWYNIRLQINFEFLSSLDEPINVMEFQVTEVNSDLDWVRALYKTISNQKENVM